MNKKNEPINIKIGSVTEQEAALIAERDALRAKNAALKAKIESVRQLIDNDRATPTHPVPFSRTDLKNHIRAILDSDVLPLHDTKEKE